MAEEREDGSARLLVAVADVDAFVSPGSATDAHARTNTTSVYTVARVFPMLPERLSTDLSSLNEGEDRLAIVVELSVAKDGAVAGSSVSRGLVRNQARLAYDAVAAWLDGETAPPAAVAATPGVEAQLLLQDRIGQALGRAATSGARSRSRPRSRGSSSTASPRRRADRTGRTARRR